MADSDGSDIRSLLESAVANAEAPVGNNAGDAGVVASPTAETDAGGQGGDSGSNGTAAPETAGQRARDATGKFAKAETSPTEIPRAKAKAVATPAPRQGEGSGTAPPATGQPTPTPQPKFKAPQAWTPAVREKWGALPEDVQAEVDRLERDTKRALQEAARPREFAQRFESATAPYRAMIQAAGGDSIGYVGNLLQTAHTLQNGTPQQRAQVAAQLVKAFGVPIDALDAALSGQEVASGPSAPQRAAFDPDAMARDIEARIAQKFEHQRRLADVDSFAKGREFFADVREEMADLIEGRARRGIELSLEEAYNLALKLHPEVSGVLSQREAAEAAKATQASTQRARAASSSLKSQPASASSGGQAKDIRGILEAAVALHSGR